MGLHKNSTDVHVVCAYEYADAATREAATGFAPADVGKFAWQQDDNSIWILTDDDPETWAQVGSSSFTPAFGVVKRTANASAGNNYTTNSATFVDVDAANLSITITTGARRCRVGLRATGGNDTGSGGTIGVDVTIDGTRMGATNGVQMLTIPNNASNNQNLSFSVITDVLTAGSHTFKLQFCTLGSGGNAMLHASAAQHLQFWVEELSVSS